MITEFEGRPVKAYRLRTRATPGKPDRTCQIYVFAKDEILFVHSDGKRETLDKWGEGVHCPIQLADGESLN